MDPLTLTTEALAQGYHQVGDLWVCLYCSHTSPSRESITAHVQQVHGGADHALLATTDKYNTLTATQQTLLAAFAAGETDAQIAAKLQVSLATVRHQRFTFREKAKQARLYLAQYQAVFGQVKPQRWLPMPPGVERQDARFKITPAEYQTIVDKFFDEENGRLTLTRLPKGQKKIIAVLYRLRQEFIFDRHYSRAQVDQLLHTIFSDHTTLKRYLVDYQFLARTADERTYWRIF
ncbi:DUF2087 domain-containing protein [Lacticaseibacillus mingshuiensis]|uniref:DUF2087 domain-containing protein n=1 Tax=Lacticaseibacillus mingshuiensis TaxID=2799574 RepID=A0ABW4CGH1_9LACO|nr:DUF2087 domain-containing protein [Lacticaseibacillus mingshuiensis]